MHSLPCGADQPLLVGLFNTSSYDAIPLGGGLAGIKQSSFQLFVLGDKFSLGGEQFC
jgi:hypothetical protein